MLYLVSRENTKEVFGLVLEYDIALDIANHYALTFEDIYIYKVDYIDVTAMKILETIEHIPFKYFEVKTYSGTIIGRMRSYDLAIETAKEYFNTWNYIGRISISQDGTTICELTNRKY